MDGFSVFLFRNINPKEREKKTTEKPKKKKKESPFFRAWMNWMQGFLL